MAWKIACRNWFPKMIVYVSSLPGDGGKDWGYTEKYDQALPLSNYWQKRFDADCKKVGVKAKFTVPDTD